MFRINSTAIKLDNMKYIWIFVYRRVNRTGHVETDNNNNKSYLTVYV